MGLSPKEMEAAIIKNLPEKTGKPLEEWLVILKSVEFESKKEMNTYLKEKFKLGHFQAQTIVKIFLERQKR